MCRNKKPRSALGPGIQPWAQASSPGPRHRAQSCYKIGPVLRQDWLIRPIGVIGNISLDKLYSIDYLLGQRRESLAD